MCLLATTMYKVQDPVFVRAGIKETRQRVIPVRATALVCLITVGAVHAASTEIAGRLQRPNWPDPSMHRVGSSDSRRVRMEAWRRGGIDSADWSHHVGLDEQWPSHGSRPPGGYHEELQRQQGPNPSDRTTLLGAVTGMKDFADMAHRCSQELPPHCTGPRRSVLLNTWKDGHFIRPLGWHRACRRRLKRTSAA